MSPVNAIMQIMERKERIKRKKDRIKKESVDDVNKSSVVQTRTNYRKPAVILTQV